MASKRTHPQFHGTQSTPRRNVDEQINWGRIRNIAAASVLAGATVASLSNVIGSDNLTHHNTSGVAAGTVEHTGFELARNDSPQVVDAIEHSIYRSIDSIREDAGLDPLAYSASLQDQAEIAAYKIAREGNKPDTLETVRQEAVRATGIESLILRQVLIPQDSIARQPGNLFAGDSSDRAAINSVLEGQYGAGQVFVEDFLNQPRGSVAVLLIDDRTLGYATINQ